MEANSLGTIVGLDVRGWMRQWLQVDTRERLPMRRDSSFLTASRKSASRKARGTYSRQLGYESLEDRRLLVTTTLWAGGTLTIGLPLINDVAVITKVGDVIKVNNLDVAAAGGGADNTKLETAELQRLVVNGGPFVGNVLTIDPSVGLLSLPSRLRVESGGELTDIQSAIAAGADVNINSFATTLESDLGTSGANIAIAGPVTLVGGTRTIFTNGNLTANAGNVTLTTVTSATAGQSLIIDARAATGFSGGIIKFNDIGNNATPLTSFEAHTNGTNGNINFKDGNVIQTDGGAVVLEAPTLDLSGADDTIDTELGGDNAGGAANLGAVALIRYDGAVLPHLLTIDTSGTTGQNSGAVTLPTSGQFVQGTSIPNFNVFNETAGRVQIRVATITNFTEDFTTPTAFNRFTSNFFTQVGTSFVADPPKGQKAIAIITPAQITPPLTNNFTISTTATLTPPGNGKFSNGFIVFDAVDPKNFKFAGAFAGRKQFSVGEVKNGKVIHKNTSPISAGSTFNLSVAINAATGNATLSNGGTNVAAFTFSPSITTTNGVGVGTNNAKTGFTNIRVIS